MASGPGARVAVKGVRVSPFQRHLLWVGSPGLPALPGPVPPRPGAVGVGKERGQ